MIAVVESRGSRTAQSCCVYGDCRGKFEDAVG